MAVATSSVVSIDQLGDFRSYFSAVESRAWFKKVAGVFH